MRNLVSAKTVDRYFENSSQFYYILTDQQGSCLYINPLLVQHAKRQGITVATDFRSLLLPSEIKKYTNIVEECMEHPGKPFPLELQHAVPAETTIRWEFMLRQDIDDEIPVIQLIGMPVNHNVTRHVKEEVRTWQERFQASEWSTESIWKMEFRIPARSEWPTEEVIQHINEFGIIADCNDNLARMYGYDDHNDLVGKAPSLVMSLEGIKQTIILKNFVEGGFSIRNAEYEELDVNGNKLYLQCNMKGIVEQGMLKRIWITQQDITERKKAEEERLRSELFYRNLIGDSLDGILLTDTNGMITFAGPSVEMILGFKPEDLVQTPAFNYVHPDDQAQALEAFNAEVNMEAEVKFIDVRLKTKSGSWIYCNVRGHNMLYNPYVGRMVIYFHDDSRRREIEDKLRESERRFRELLNNMHTGVVLKSKNDKVLVCNRAAHELLGLSEDELIEGPTPTGWKAINEDGREIPAGETPVAVSVRTRAAARDIVIGIERPREKDTIWLLVNAEPIFGPDKEILYVICSFTDISEQKKLSRQLISQEIQKQKLLTQATIDGQEKERKEIGKELHDNISQHLTTTRLYLEVAIDKSSGEVKEVVRHAHNILSSIIDEIRVLSQSLVPPTLGDIGLVESIEDICNDLKRIHKLTVNFEHSSFHECGLADSMKLMLFRVIQEQFNNIMRHSGASNVKMELERGDETIVLRIKDNGQGFNPGTVKRGLGLTNMYNRVTLFNGEMLLEAAPGQGCMLLVTLPLK